MQAHTHSLLVLCFWRTLRLEAPSRAGSENFLSPLLGPESCLAMDFWTPRAGLPQHSCVDRPVLSACPECRTMGFHSIAAWTVLSSLRVQSAGPWVSDACGWTPCSWRKSPLVLESCFPTFRWRVHLSAVLPVSPLQIRPEVGFLRLLRLPPLPSAQAHLTPPEIRAAFL